MSAIVEGSVNGLLVADLAGTLVLFRDRAAKDKLSMLSALLEVSFEDVAG